MKRGVFFRRTADRWLDWYRTFVPFLYMVYGPELKRQQGGWCHDELDEYLRHEQQTLQDREPGSGS